MSRKSATVFPFWSLKCCAGTRVKIGLFTAYSTNRHAYSPSPPLFVAFDSDARKVPVPLHWCLLLLLRVLESVRAGLRIFVPGPFDKSQNSGAYSSKTQRRTSYRALPEPLCDVFPNILPRDIGSPRPVLGRKPPGYLMSHCIKLAVPCKRSPKITKHYYRTLPTSFIKLAVPCKRSQNKITGRHHTKARERGMRELTSWRISLKYPRQL